MASDDLPPPSSLLSTLGSDVLRIITPVSLCMLLVVLLVSSLSSSTGSASSFTTDFNFSDSSSTWDEIKSALFTSLYFVTMVTVMTFVLVLLFYFRCINFLKVYMGVSSFFVLTFLGGFVVVLLISEFRVRVDVLTFVVVLVNVAICGVLSIFLPKFPILVNQGVLVIIGVLTAYWFTFLPEWTTWVLLVFMSLYDLFAVLVPVGPLRLLVELAISRDENIPALVYESRPVNPVPDSGTRVWRRRRRGSGNDSSGTDEITAPLIGTVPTSPLIGTVPVISDDEINVTGTRYEEREEDFETIGLGSSGGIKLGLGDFIFYSLLVGRASMYDFMAVYACYFAIIAGLGVTLVILAFCEKALPALPISVLFLD